jgi:hypothetical protein
MSEVSWGIYFYRNIHIEQEIEELPFQAQGVGIENNEKTGQMCSFVYIIYLLHCFSTLFSLVFLGGFLVSFCDSTGVWTQDFVLVKQAFLPSSQTSRSPSIFK